MKKILIIILSIICIFLLVGCSNGDNVKFKNEYESLNGTTNSRGKTIRKVSIDKNNPFVYAEAEEIVSMIKNKESFVVYFGFSTCPWCRSMIENLVAAAKDTGIKKIYYVDVLEIRDVLKVDDNNNVYKETEGDKYYLQLLNLLDNVLEDYALTNNEGKSVETNEKRIYAPNVIVVRNGEALGLTTGISELQTDSYMELTEEINNESYNMLKELLNQFNNSCDEKSC